MFVVSPDYPITHDENRIPDLTTNASVALLSVLFVACFAAERVEASDADDGWKLANEHSGVTIYSRSHRESSLKEFKALGEIAVTCRAVSEVIEDLGIGQRPGAGEESGLCAPFCQGTLVA